MNKHLVTTADVKKTREELLKEQKDCCKITGAILERKDAVLDHCHDSQLVRGVIHRQLNTMLGKIEGAYIRMIRWWCPIPLPRLLRMFAYYLDNTKEEPLDVYHPGWIKRNVTDFNKLNSKAQIAVLSKFKVDNKTKNAAERKKVWKELLVKKQITHDDAKLYLHLVSEKQQRGDYD